MRIFIALLILLGIVALIEWGGGETCAHVGPACVLSLDSPDLVGVALAQFGWIALYFFRWQHWRESSPQLLLWTNAVLISLILPKLFLVGVEVLDGLRYWSQWAFTGKTARADVPRRTFITLAGQATAGVLLGAFAHGMTRGRKAYHIRRHEVPMAGLPAALDGLRIVQISDAHWAVS